MYQIFKIMLFLLLPFALSAQNNASLFDAYMKAQFNLYGFNGNVLISKKGIVIYKQSFGFSNYETRTTLDDNSVVDCGSIAKEFTVVGILLLKDKGRLSYSDKLKKFFPQLSHYNVTIQQLLTHTSGLPDGFDLVEKYFNHNKIAVNDDLIHLMETKKPELLFKPGGSLMYSGTAFNLLASIIENLSGESYKSNRFLNR